ncbi:MAG: RNA methyltransferase, partial [Acutalibacteraceae bacterium]|nr:RNA methyltransferase [Acutalibacteraceae bacterium]
MDVVRSGLRCAELFVSEEFCAKHGAEYEALVACSDEVFLVNDAVLEKLSDTRTPQGVCCVVRMAAPASLLSDERPAAKLLLLENVQDPANLGAIARTAEALGISGLLVSGGCDVYAPKALRASMGALLRLPVEVVDASREGSEPVLSLLEKAEALGFKTYASTPAADAVPVTEADFSGKVLCVVGNEANGVTPETMTACAERVTIPMAGRAESLNAAAAGAILMWEMVR